MKQNQRNESENYHQGRSRKQVEQDEKLGCLAMIITAIGLIIAITISLII